MRTYSTLSYMVIIAAMCFPSTETTQSFTNITTPDSCPPNRWGWQCIYTCHCKDTKEHCDVTSGSCLSGCHDEWVGPGCSIGNVAYGKASVQSSTRDNYVALNSLYDNGQCSITLLDREPWYMIDLKQQHVITNVVIRNVQFGGGSLYNFDVRIADVSDPSENLNHVRCVHHLKPVSDDEEIELHCENGPTVGRYVIIRLLGRADVLRMCGIKVIGYVYADAGCPPSMWGPSCLWHCPRCKDDSETELCNYFLGQCPSGCHEAWTGESCAIGNVAQGSQCVQSSTYGRYYCDLAIDGNKETDFFKGGTCTHTNQDYEPWLTLDFGRTAAIETVYITNRHDGPRSVKNRLKDVEVWVSDYPMTSKEITSSSIFCDIHDGLIKPGKSAGIHCGDNTSGRFLSVVMKNKRQYLTICELEVQGFLQQIECPVGLFGVYCDVRCDCPDRCHWLTGECMVSAYQGEGRPQHIPAHVGVTFKPEKPISIIESEVDRVDMKSTSTTTFTKISTAITREPTVGSKSHVTTAKKSSKRTNQPTRPTYPRTKVVTTARPSTTRVTAKVSSKPSREAHRDANEGVLRRTDHQSLAGLPRPPTSGHIMTEAPATTIVYQRPSEVVVNPKYSATGVTKSGINIMGYGSIFGSNPMHGNIRRVVDYSNVLNKMVTSPPTETTVENSHRTKVIYDEILANTGSVGDPSGEYRSANGADSQDLNQETDLPGLIRNTESRRNSERPIETTDGPITLIPFTDYPSNFRHLKLEEVTERIGTLDKNRQSFTSPTVSTPNVKTGDGIADPNFTDDNIRGAQRTQPSSAGSPRRKSSNNKNVILDSRKSSDGYPTDNETPFEFGSMIGIGGAIDYGLYNMDNLDGARTVDENTFISPNQQFQPINEFGGFMNLAINQLDPIIYNGEKRDEGYTYSPGELFSTTARNFDSVSLNTNKRPQHQRGTSKSPYMDITNTSPSSGQLKHISLQGTVHSPTSSSRAPKVTRKSTTTRKPIVTTTRRAATAPPPSPSTSPPPSPPPSSPLSLSPSSPPSPPPSVRYNLLRSVRYRQKSGGPIIRGTNIHYGPVQNNNVQFILDNNMQQEQKATTTQEQKTTTTQSLQEQKTTTTQSLQPTITLRDITESTSVLSNALLTSMKPSNSKTKSTPQNIPITTRLLTTKKPKTNTNLLATRKQTPETTRMTPNRPTNKPTNRPTNRPAVNEIPAVTETHYTRSSTPVERVSSENMESTTDTKTGSGSRHTGSHTGSSSGYGMADRFNPYTNDNRTVDQYTDVRGGYDGQEQHGPATDDVNGTGDGSGAAGAGGVNVTVCNEIEDWWAADGIDESCFHILDAEVTREIGMLACRSMEAQLVSLQTEPKLHALVDMLLPTDGDLITSGFCSFFTNKCYWQEGTPVTHFVSRYDDVMGSTDTHEEGEPTLILHSGILHTLTAVPEGYRGYALCEKPSE